MSTFRRFIMAAVSSVRSCFGSGRWISKKPWIGKEKWKNNK